MDTPGEFAPDNGDYRPMVELSFRIVNLPGVFTVRIASGPGWTAQAAERIKIATIEVLAIYLGNANGAEIVPGFEPPPPGGTGGV